MTDQLPPPPVPEESRKRRRWPWVALGAVGVLAVGAISGTGGDDAAPASTTAAATTTTAAPTTTAASGMTDAEIEQLALDLTDLEGSMRRDVCPIFRDLVASGMSVDALVSLAVTEFEAGYGRPLTRAGRDRVEAAVRQCER